MDSHSPAQSNDGSKRSRRRRRGQALSACLALAAVSVAVTGCGSSHHSPTTSSTRTTAVTTGNHTTAHTTTTATHTTTSKPTTTARTTTTQVKTTATTVQAAECTQRQLQASVANGSAAAGTTYYDLTLTNSSSKSCWEQGYAGVSLVRAEASGDFVQIGAAGRRLPGSARQVMLAPGKTAYATLGVADAQNYPASKCKPETSEYLKVYPPNQTAAFALKFSVQGCSESASQILLIGPFKSSPGND